MNEPAQPHPGNIRTITGLIAWMLCLLPCAGLQADGYPFDERTQEVIGANLRLPLTVDQQTEVASTGLLTFTKEQIGWLRLIYPKIPAKLRVIAATSNDGLDVRPPNPVDCLWTAPAEVAITLRDRDDKEDYTFDAEEPSTDISCIRISPDGAIYHQGQEIGLEKAFEIVRTAKKQDGAPADDSPTIAVTRSPPYRTKDDESAAFNRKAADVFSALALYGESLKVNVAPSW